MRERLARSGRPPPNSDGLALLWSHRAPRPPKTRSGRWFAIKYRSIRRTFPQRQST